MKNQSKKILNLLLILFISLIVYSQFATLEKGRNGGHRKEHGFFYSGGVETV
jgi:hypothetical protein